MPDNSKNDWLVASLSKPDFTLGDFEQVGLTPSNTQLLNEKDYKNSDQIQKMFTNPETGKFDDVQFKQHYDTATQTFNDFAKKEYDTTLLNNNYFFEENFHAPKDAKRFKQTINIGKVKNPFNQVSGIEGFTTKTDSGLSVREIAQTQNVQDHLTDKPLDYTPNESGFFGTVFKATSVLAQWDTTGEHYDADLGKKVKHQKGDFKYNENGKPYYETLGNREVYGKQALSGWDVLTEDGSSANKWDFMDADSKTKSLTGTIFKTAATVVPMFIPGVGQWYTGITLGHALMTDLLPVLAKSTAGLFLNEDLKDTGLFKYANDLQAFGAKFKGSISDEGKESMFNKENIFAMAGDVFGQLAQQRLIAKIPLWLGQSAKEAQALEAVALKYGEKELGNIQKALKSIKGPQALQQRANLLRDTYGADESLVGILNKWDKWGSIGSKSLGISYMAGISATSVAEEAKMQGLDERDTAALFLGTMAGFGLMMTKFEFAHWALQGMGLDEVGGFMKSTIKNRVREIAPTINRIADASEHSVIGAAARNLDGTVAAEVVQGGVEATKKTAREKLLSLFNKGKEIGKSVSASMDDISTIKQKMLAESLEETTEEAMQDGIKLIYNGMRSLGMTSTNQDDSKAFTFQDMAGRYLMSAVGGAMGGGIAGVQDKLSGHVHDSLPPTLRKEIASAVRHGYASQLQDIVDKQRDQGKLGSTSLSIQQYTPEYKLNDDINYKPMDAESGATSHNDFVHAMISSEIKLAKDAIFQEGIQSDIRLNDIYNERTELFVDYKLNTGIVSDIDKLTNDIIDKKAELNKLQGGVKEGASSETSEEKSKITTLNKEIEELREEMQEIVSGDRMLKYTKEALFSVNRSLHEPFGIENKDSLAFREYQKRYEHLSTVEKEDINQKYQEYATLEKRTQLRRAHKEFEKIATEDFNAFIPELSIYAQQRKAFLNDFVDLPTTLARLEMAKESDVDTVDNSTLNQLNLGAIKLDRSKSDIANLAHIIKSEKYINPVMYDFVKNNYDIPYKTESGVDLASVFTEIYSDEKVGLLPYEINPGDVDLDSIKSATGIDVRELLVKLSPWNFAETQEKLAEITRLPEFKEMTDQATTLDEGIVDFQTVADAFNGAITNIIDSIMKIRSVDGENMSLTDNTARVEEVDAIESIKKDYLTKPNNPLLDFISTLTKREGREGFGNLIDIINSTFNDLSNKGVASDFIIDNKISVEQLEYGRNMLNKVAAVMEASIDWAGPTSDTQLIGYNSAINAIAERSRDEEHELLNVMTGEEGMTVAKELATLTAKINFLLNLHTFNSNGSIRELKLTGATMSTLYLESISPDSYLYDHLKGLGIDLSDVATKFGMARQYSENLAALRSPNDSKLALKSDDDSFFKIRAEKDAIEQALFKAVNTHPDRVEILNKIFDTLNQERYAQNNGKIDFSSNVRHLPRGQELMYLAQVVTIDPKQFYKDFVGDLEADEDKIKDDPYAPFYGQEHVLKQMYWQMIAKMFPVNTYKKVADILLKPDSTLTEEQRKIFAEDLEVPTLKNAAILYGIPGAGKTTSALYYLAKIAEDYGIDVAVFAPHQEQGDKLKESLKDRKNVFNDSRSLSSLMKTILGEELYSQIDTDYNTGSIVEHDIKVPMEQAPVTSSIMNLVGSVRSSITMNPNHPLIAKFLADKSKLISLEGRVPGMIIIDEATHIRGVELELLNKAVEYHNINAAQTGAQQISLYLVGDREQRGFSMKINEELVTNNMTVMFGMNTPVLSQSLRNRFNVKNKNLYGVRALRKTIEEAHEAKDFGTVADLIDTGISFDYAIDDQYGLVGEQLTSEFTKENLELLFSNPTDTVALITDKSSPSLMKLIDSIPGATQRLKIHSPDAVQGLEYDNIIIDIKSTDRRPKNLREMRFTYEALEMLYTMISRSKKGSLIKTPFIGSINLTDNTEDVLVQKIELAPNVISDYKTFTLTGIDKSFRNLENLSLSPTERRTVPTPVSTEGLTADQSDTVFTDEAFKVVGTQLEGKEEDTSVSIDLKGEAAPVDMGETRPITYSFHERLGFETSRGKILDTQSNPIIANQDLAGIYNIMNDTELDDTISMTNSKVQAARNTIKRLKAGIMAHSQKVSNGESVPNLKSFLFTYYKVNEKVLNKFDWNNVKLKIETKEYDNRVDTSYNGTDAEVTAKGGGLISYLVMELPHIKGGEHTFLTLTAFPNTNNENVAKLRGVMATMAAIRDNHVQFSTNGVSDFYLKPTVTLSKIVTPTSNMYIRRQPAVSFKEFKEQHSHLQVSDPYIVMNTNIINQDNEVAQSLFANFNRGPFTEAGGINTESYSLIGKPVVFVSLDKSIPQTQLADLYIKQLNDQTTRKLAGESVEGNPGNIRMIMLNRKGVDFKEWLAKNIDIAFRLSEDDIDLKAQRRAYSNNFAAAGMLGALVNFKRRAEYYQTNGDPSQLRANLGLKEGTYGPKALNQLIEQVDAIIRTALPLLTGRTYEDLYMSSTTTDGAINKYVASNQGKVDNFLTTLFEGKDSNKNKAVEHFIASDLLEYILKHEKDGGAKVIKDKDDKNLKLNLPNSALHNFVNAIRLTIAGGTFNNSEGVATKLDGLYPSAFKAQNQDTTEYDKMVDGLMDILSYKFPDGIHINPVLRTTSKENRYQGDAPFVVPTGNIDDDFKVDVKVQTPTIYFDPSSVDFRNPDVVAEEQDAMVEEFKGIQEGIGEIISNFAPSITALPEMESLIESIINSTVSTHSLDVESPVEIKQILDGKTIDQIKEEVTQTVIQSVAEKIDTLPDNVVKVADMHHIISVDENGVTLTPLLQGAGTLAREELARLNAPEKNIIVNLTTVNKPGTTEKVREFTITNADNGEIIGNFAYEAKQFTKLNYLGQLPVNTSGIAKVVAGTFVESHFAKLDKLIQSPEIANNFSIDDKSDIGKSYFLVGSFLKANAFDAELQELRNAYDNILKQIKC